MKILIAIPCMDMVHTPFFKSVISMRCPANAEVEFTIASGSLIYDARNILAKKAIDKGFDRVLWLDSDMEFAPDMFLRLNDDMDSGMDYVAGLYFKRKKPIAPVVYKDIGLTTDENNPGKYKAYTTPFSDYPEDSVFEIQASGFGAVMTSVSLLEKLGKEYGLPFSPVNGFGEDLSFCLRVHDLGIPMYCDSRVKLGHVGYYSYNEETFKKEIMQ